MSLIDKYLNQKVIYWRYLGIDQYGKSTYAAPEELDCRWTDIQAKEIDMQGELFYATSTALLLQDVSLKDMLMLGSISDLTDIEQTPSKYENARTVRSFKKVANRQATWYLRKAYLQ
jgi:hypothetical protein